MLREQQPKKADMINDEAKTELAKHGERKVTTAWGLAYGGYTYGFCQE